MSTLLRWLAAAVLAYALLMALLWWNQERLIFMPTRLASDHLFNQATDVHEVTVDVPGAKLHALHLRHSEPRGIVFFLHGNAGNLATWFLDTRVYRELGLDLFMLDYRGYGKSSGQITSEAQLHADVRAAWDLIAGRYRGKPAIFFGRSLGTGLAARLAADLPPAERPRTIVLASPYESLQALAREHYPFVPPAVLRYTLRTDLALRQLDANARLQE